ncbi:site-2 protease family protein [Leptolyngbyaceae cyanobacterium CCMR0082]|uniref:Site-2 protease family protein n=3 Tax=Adonisia TaxID=2950183 RepID=A0A6M0S1W7_9CYAN|nr:site-2 protease family protein [Adonisia turfae]NEZ59288.1 site-2 protease family protein [Adonisia turfae CCMR0081]NEZ62240.1 site-2 protease family protein [Adonisia turfae CCMR0082]
MTFVLLSILLGILTYLVIRRGVATMTRSPVWLLWLIIMTPILALTAWVLKHGRYAPPNIFILGLFIVCPLIYMWVVLLGRRPSAQRPSTLPPHRPAPAPPMLMEREEEERLRSCFPWSIYFLQKIEHRQQMMICHGRLKATPAVAHSTVQQNVRSQFGHQFLVVLQEERNGDPVFTLVPNREPANSSKDSGWRLSILLFILTLGTTTLAGLLLVGDLSIPELLSQPALLVKGLGYSLAVMMILAVRELAHYAMARRHHIPASAPFFIPVPYFLGTIGAFVRIKAPAPNRRALFDLGVAGPLAGFLVSLPIVIWGLAHSQMVELTEESGLFNFQSLDPKGSILLVLLSKLALGSDFQIDTALYLHSVAIAGCLGLVLTALNLMPVGQLDGGHIVHAMYGRWSGAAIGNITRILVAAMAFIQPAYLLWALLLIFMSSRDEPALDDVSELNGVRDALGLIAMVILVLIVLPMPQTISEHLL